MSELIAFTSTVIGSGKSTAANMLHEVAAVPAKHFETSDCVISFANGWLERTGEITVANEHDLVTLSELAAQASGNLVGADTDFTENISSLNDYLAWRHELPEADKIITRANKDEHRPVLQWLGAEMVTQVDKSFWTRMMEQSIIAAQRDGVTKLITACGIRYDDNALMIRARGGQIVEVVRPVVTPHALQGHAAERGISRELIDFTIHNDSDLATLRAKVQRFWESTQTTYI